MVFTIPGCSREPKLTKVNLTEVAHSIFYAPMYVAFENGYFEEEGLDVSLTNGLGADKTMTALLSGDCDIGFMGSEASIYVYKEGASDYAVNFAQLTQRAGNFLVARDGDSFQWEQLKGKTIIGGRQGGMPEMVLEYVLKKKGIDPQKDLTIIKNIDFGMTAEAFASGKGDYTVEFEPAAYSLEKEEKGTVVASIGVESGNVPYTAFMAKQSYLTKHPATIQAFTNALQKGMDYVNSHSPEEIAQVIAPQFDETESEALVAIVKRYQDQDTWKDNLVYEEDSFTLLEDILKNGGELDENVPYEDLVTTEFAKKVLKK
ncbi:MAG: ABC transporter substrate-binding protein [Clostridiales bacterium]|nr:ABC transporter substrate-binding protein [Clostridiales bacterium]